MFMISVSRPHSFLPLWLCDVQVVNIGKQDLPSPVKALMRAPLVERMIAEIFQIFIMTPKDVGSYDLEAKQEALVY